MKQGFVKKARPLSWSDRLYFRIWPRGLSDLTKTNLWLAWWSLQLTIFSLGLITLMVMWITWLNGGDYIP